MKIKDIINNKQKPEDLKRDLKRIKKEDGCPDQKKKFDKVTDGTGIDRGTGKV